MEIRDANVLVVGASGGLGSAIAAALGRRGARLTLHGRDRDSLAGVAAPLGARTVRADLRDAGGPDRVVRAVLEAGDRIDAVVQCAGPTAFGPIEDLDADVLRELLEVNVVAPARVMRAALPHMGEGSAFVNVSAIVAEMPTMRMRAYSASKAALTALDSVARRELRPRKVRVLDVRPPQLATGLDRRPLAGEAPRLPEGRDPAAAAELIVAALEHDLAEVGWEERDAGAR